MVCQWKFRTFSPKNDTEISYRGVPGIRVPGPFQLERALAFLAGLEVDVLESRVWKDLDTTKNNEQSALALMRSEKRGVENEAVRRVHPPRNSDSSDRK